MMFPFNIPCSLLPKELEGLAGRRAGDLRRRYATQY